MKHSLTERFPALRYLSTTGHRRRVPVIMQLSATDCGAAALAMVLAYHRKEVSIGDVRRTLAARRDGTSAASLLRVGRTCGLKGRAVRLELDELSTVPAGAILFWQFNHYVVFERLRRTTVELVDPVSGRRVVPLDHFRKAFTGVALLFEPEERAPGTVAKPRRVRSVSVLSRCAAHFAGSGLAGRVIFASMLVQILSATTPFMVGAIVDRAVPLRDPSLVFVLALLFCSAQLFSTLAEFVRSQLLVHLRTHIEMRLTVKFIDRLIDLPYAFFQQHTSGDLLQRLWSHGAVRDILASAAMTGLIDGLMASTYLVLLAVISPSLARLVFCLAIARLVLVFAIRSRQRQLLAERLENTARAQTFDFEMLSAMEMLKSMGLEERAAARWSDHFVAGLNISVKQGRLDSLFGAVLGVIEILSPLVLTFYASLLVIRADLTLGTMLACSALAAAFLGPLDRFVKTAFQLQTLDVYLERIDDVIDATPEQGSSAPQASGPLTGEITVDRISFRYDQHSPLVLDDISFHVKAGTSVAIVGPTGCGKSTVARLLAGLYEPTSGRVLLDGKDLRSLDHRAVREQLGMVTQDTQLFSGSIRGNVALANPEAALDTIVRAARMACIHDDIEAMPMGYETILADRGLSLSGGQRQRLAIARAVARNPRILLLDEATSHLDARTEAAVASHLAQVKSTRVVIAHRLNTIRHADQIIVMESGKVVQTGHHDELVAKEGPYAALFERQLEGTRS